MLLPSQWIKEWIKREIWNLLEASENGNASYQNLWDSAVWRGNSTYITEEESFVIKKTLVIHLQKLDKWQRTKLKVDRRKEIMKIILIITILKISQKIEKGGVFPNWFHLPSVTLIPKPKKSNTHNEGSQVQTQYGQLSTLGRLCLKFKISKINSALKL